MFETSVTVGQGGKKRKGPKWRVVIVFVLVIILAAGAGVGIRWIQQRYEQRQAAKPDAIEQVTTEVQDIAGLGDFDEAHEVLDEALNRPGLSEDGKYSLVFQQGITYENEEKYDEAINSYREAESIKETQEVAEAIARAAESKGDNELAISYYKKAITLIDDTKPRAESIKQYYEASIKSLEGGQ